MYEVISSGSKGNAVLYFGSILVDCGVSFAAIKPYLKQIQILLLTHEHGDHFNYSTIQRLAFERPSLRIGGGEWMIDKVKSFCKNVDEYQPGQMYDYGLFKVSPVIAFHDVPNFGYRLIQGEKKIFHITDTFTLKGITARNYDLYAIEANYDEELVEVLIEEKISRGEYAYQVGAKNSHLSFQEAYDFFYANKGEHSQMVRLHETSSML